MKSLRFLAAAALVLAIAAVPAVAQGPSAVLDVDDAPVQRTIDGAAACTTGAPLVSQAPNQTNGLFSDSDCGLCGTGAQAVAENFVLAADTSIGEFVIWGGFFPGDMASPDDITVIIHDDAAGVPGAPIATFNGLTSTRQTTGVVLFGVSEYVFNIVLPAPVALTAGTYWVEIHNNTIGNVDQFFWELGDLDATAGVPDSVFATEVPGVTWNASVGVDFAMIVCEGDLGVNPLEIPTVGTIGFAILALLLVLSAVFVMRRRTV